MPLSITRTSGSVDLMEDDWAEEVDDGNDLLRECEGGCGKKILFFSSPRPKKSKKKFTPEELEQLMCLECRSKPLKQKGSADDDYIE